MTETGKKVGAAHWLGYSACAAAGCLWGTGFYFGRLALNEMSVEYMVLYRFLFAMVGMLPVLLRGRVRFERRELRMLLASAALWIPIQFLLQFHGLARTTVSHAALMVGAMPVMLAVGATIFAHERLDWVGWAAIAASTAGVVLVVVGGNHGTGRGGPTLTGDLLVVVSLFAALVSILMNKRLMERHSPPVVTAYLLLTGTVMLMMVILGPVVLKPLCLRFGLPNNSVPMPFAHLSGTAWAASAVSGIFCTAATTLLWNWGIHHVPASRAGVFLNIEPALGSVLGVRLLGEHLGPYAWLGGGMIVGAAVVMTARSSVPEVVLE
jgi:drug/metabolite transporter (DMT)-like permease